MPLSPKAIPQRPKPMPPSPKAILPMLEPKAIPPRPKLILVRSKAPTRSRVFGWLWSTY
jgi:hypothetical protein